MNGARPSSTLLKPYRRILAVSILITLTLYLALLHHHHSASTNPPIRPTTPQHSTPASPSTNLPSTTLVVSSTSTEHTQWLTAHFPNTTTALYIVDNSTSTSPFQTPANKGNEAMVYLSYMIDHYHRLPTVAIFIHAHLHSKHTDDLLANSMLETLQRLRLHKVQADGYFNLRCNWMPGGCPRYLNLRDPERSASEGSAQARTLKRAWRELFPDRVDWPEWVGQPYGAQFAASRDAIRRVPLQTWVCWREWLLATELSDYDSGRVWEYSWQYVLAGEANFCPSMDQCYCEGYGVCFGGEQALEEWADRRRKLEERWAEYLLTRPVGREAVEMKRRLMGERKALDRVLIEAKERGDGGGR